MVLALLRLEDVDVEPLPRYTPDPKYSAGGVARGEWTCR